MKNAKETVDTGAANTAVKAAATAAKAKDKRPTVKLQFVAYAKDLVEAMALVRGSVEAIRSLRDSLIGLKPTCAEDLGIDLEEHAAKCAIADEEGMMAFIGYMQALIKRGCEVKPDAPPAVLKVFRGNVEEHTGFSYTTGAERARVGSYWDVHSERWMVSGYVRLKNAVLVEKKLAEMDFETTRHIEKK